MQNKPLKDDGACSLCANSAYRMAPSVKVSKAHAPISPTSFNPKEEILLRKSLSHGRDWVRVPDVVKTEVQASTDVNLAWLKKTLVGAKVASPKEAEKRARAIYSGIVGAQLMARSRADIALYDSLIESYRTAGLLPA
jgi:hypothetical protein